MKNKKELIVNFELIYSFLNSRIYAILDEFKEFTKVY